MKVVVVSKDVGAWENGAKAQFTLKYSPTRPKTRLQKRRLWVGGSCWGIGTEFKLATKTWVRKENSSYKFS